MPKPIGYWVKELDRRLEAGFDRELGASGTTRRQWQVLNLLPATASEVDRSMAPFEPTAAPVVDVLVERGWARHDEIIELTDEGAEARADIGVRVDRLRARVVEGVSEEEYLATVQTLAKMVHNLD
ncbi:MarR family transcriptional regulator [Actinokineospora sp. NBRC 105648]|uniref:MarR family winged helix-turn-helix transcriptional regulator n=1 Tax=Actinokineospora sp. NBRC 105648 TaxID=3032206 RepID=UPI0024A572E5|nr:MarR family transcriptional regulator [Actinokineospora sp. NBRC 105648]GLZ37431.1 hypothetical protein Acsp05_10560 [Actinokineospora sp. NBRC 105648]